MNDKIKHIAAGLVTLFVGIPCYQLTYDAASNEYCLAAALWSTIVSGVLLAGCKEWCDVHTPGNKWDWKDFGYTCIGAAISAVVIVLMHFAKG